MKRFFLGAVFFVSCASSPVKAPPGVWKMSEVTAPTSSLEDQFPAAKWAENMSTQSFVGLSEDGKIYSGIPKEGPLLDGSWSGAEVTFSFPGTSQKNMTMTTFFRGIYEPQKDAITGEISQKILITKDVTLEYTGQIEFTRVTVQ